MHPDVLTTTPLTKSRSPFEADVWNRYYADWMNGFRAQSALWNDKDGGELIAMDPDGKTVGIAGAMEATSSGLTVSVPATFQVNVTLGDAAGDTITINGTLVANAPASFNGDVTLGDAAGDDVTVHGTLVANAPATFADTVTLNGATTANANVTLTGASVLTLPNGSAASPSLAVGDAGGLFRQAAGVLGFSAGGAERARLSSSGLLMAAATPIILANTQAYRIIDSSAVQQNVLTLSASDVVTVGYAAAVQTDVEGAIVRLRAGGTTRIRVDGTGIGLFGATPVAQPTISGSRGGNAALADLLNELDTMGLVNDTTTA